MITRILAVFSLVVMGWSVTQASDTYLSMDQIYAVQDTDRIIMKPWEVKRTFEYDKVYTDINFGTLQKGPGVFLSMAAVKQISKYKGFGAGLDYAEYSLQSPHGFIAPHIVYRGYLYNKKNGLFVSGKAGYGFSVSGRDDGEFSGTAGLYTEGSINARIGLVKPMLVVGLGLRAQRLDLELVRPGSDVDQNGWFRRLSISVGIMF